MRGDLTVKTLGRRYYSRVSEPAQPCGLKIRAVDAGYAASFDAGLTGRGVRLPPQLGQQPPSCSEQSRQNVHSKVQIIASVADGSRSLPQHSQLGRNSSISHPFP